MTPTEAEVEAFARKLAAEAGWERYVDTARRTLEAAPTDAPVTDTLPAEAIDLDALAELAKRLRREATAFDNDLGSDPEADAGTARLLREAAGAIKRLISERDEAREALRPFEELSDIFDATGASKIGGPDLGRLLRSARAVLSPKPAKSEGE